MGINRWRKRLALLLNSSSPLFNKALGNLAALIAPTDFQTLEERRPSSSALFVNHDNGIHVTLLGIK